MKTKFTKVLALTLCAVLLVVGSVMGTVAYLTAQDEVVNTFTFGNVVLTMDEAETDLYGNVVSGSRVKSNTYKLIPNHVYQKDLQLHTTADSESCYLFVKFEDSFVNVADFVLTGWERYGTTNIYYLEDSVDPNTTVNVLASFTAKSSLTVTSQFSADIFGYAVQADGFTDAEAAWNATFGAPAQNNG